MPARRVDLVLLPLMLSMYAGTGVRSAMQTLSPLCPDNLGVAVGLGGLTYKEAFNFEHNAQNADFTCRRPCDGRGTTDTATCTGPHGCGVYSCLMSVNEQLHEDPRRAAACPVAMEAGDLPSEQFAKTEVSCVLCSECGHSRNYAAIADWGRGCSRECTQRLCDDGDIYDWTTQTCKECEKLQNSSLCSDADKESQGLNAMTVTGYLPTVVFNGCTSKSANVGMKHFTYGSCQKCTEFPTCTDTEFPLACNKCESCDLARAAAAVVALQFSPSVYVVDEQLAMYCQIAGCVDAGKTGIDRQGQVCTRSCSKVVCEPDVEHELPCRLPMNARCVRNYPQKATADPRQSVGQIDACVNVAEPCATGVSLSQLSFENALVDETFTGDGVLLYGFQCVWNADGISDNIMHPGGVSATFSFPGYSTDSRYSERGTRFCRSKTSVVSDVEYPLLPLQNVVANGTRGVFVNMPARVALYGYSGEGFGVYGDPRTFVPPAAGARSLFGDVGVAYLALDTQRSYRGKIAVPIPDPGPWVSTAPIFWQVSVLAAHLQPRAGSDVACQMQKPVLESLEMYDSDGSVVLLHEHNSTWSDYEQQVQRVVETLNTLNPACLGVDGLPLEDTTVVGPCWRANASMSCVDSWNVSLLAWLAETPQGTVLARKRPWPPPVAESVSKVVMRLGSLASLHVTGIVDVDVLGEVCREGAVTGVVGSISSSCLALIYTRTGVLCLEPLFTTRVVFHTLDNDIYSQDKRVVDAAIASTSNKVFVLDRNVVDGSPGMYIVSENGAVSSMQGVTNELYANQNMVVAIAVREESQKICLYTLQYSSNTSEVLLHLRNDTTYFESAELVWNTSSHELSGTSLSDLDASRVVLQGDEIIVAMISQPTTLVAKIHVYHIRARTLVWSDYVDVPASALQPVLSVMWVPESLLATAFIGYNGAVFKYVEMNTLERKVSSPIAMAHFSNVMNSVLLLPFVVDSSASVEDEYCGYFTRTTVLVPSNGLLKTADYTRAVYPTLELCKQVCHVDTKCLWFAFDATAAQPCLLGAAPWDSGPQTDLQLQYDSHITGRTTFCVRPQSKNMPYTLQIGSTTARQTPNVTMWTPFSEDDFQRMIPGRSIEAYGLLLVNTSKNGDGTLSVRAGRYADVLLHTDYGSELQYMHLFTTAPSADNLNALTALPAPSVNDLLHTTHVLRWNLTRKTWASSCNMPSRDEVLTAIQVFSVNEHLPMLLEPTWKRLRWRVAINSSIGLLPTKYGAFPGICGYSTEGKVWWMNQPYTAERGLELCTDIAVQQQQPMSFVFIQGPSASCFSHTGCKSPSTTNCTLLGEQSCEYFGNNYMKATNGNLQSWLIWPLAQERYSVPKRLVFNIPSTCDVGLDNIQVVPLVSGNSVSRVQTGVAFQELNVTMVSGYFVKNAVRGSQQRWERLHLHVELAVFPEHSALNCSYHVVPYPTLLTDEIDAWWQTAAASAGCLVVGYPLRTACALEYPLSYIDSSTHSGKIAVRPWDCLAAGAVPPSGFYVTSVEATVLPGMTMYECTDDMEYFSALEQVCLPCAVNESVAGMLPECVLGEYVPGCVAMAPPQSWRCEPCAVEAVNQNRANYSAIGVCDFVCHDAFYRSSAEECTACTPEAQVRAACPVGSFVRACTNESDTHCALCDALPELEEYVPSDNCASQCVAGYYKSLRLICEECTSFNNAIASAGSAFVRVDSCTPHSDVEIRPCQFVAHADIIGHAPSFDLPCPFACHENYILDSSGQVCVSCNVSDQMPAGALFGFSANCTLECLPPWEERNGVCRNCDPTQCQAYEYIDGFDCELCLPCVALAPEMNREYVAAGSFSNSSCKIDCLAGFYNRYIDVTEPCVAHSPEPTCAATQFKIPADSTKDWVCEECATCLGMNMTRPCAETSNAECVACPPTSPMMKYVLSNCTEVCQDGFWLDTTLNVCEYCRYTCPPGSYAPDPRAYCEECKACANELPPNAQWLAACVWECQPGFEETGTESCKQHSAVFTTSKQSPNTSLVLKCDMGTIWTQNGCIPCADVYGSSVFPPVAGLSVSWEWTLGAEVCAWRCTSDYTKHRQASGQFVCIGMLDVYARVRSTSLRASTFGQTSAASRRARGFAVAVVTVVVLLGVV